MVDNKYAVAYSELLEILKYIPIEDYNKIPKTKLAFFEANTSKDSTFSYDPNKSLEEQNVSKITKGIIILLFRDYWATETQKNKIIAKQNYDRMKLEEEKKKMYNPNMIFTKHTDTTSNDTEKKSNLALIAVNDVKWYKKIWDFFKKILKK